MINISFPIMQTINTPQFYHRLPILIFGVVLLTVITSGAGLFYIQEHLLQGTGHSLALVALEIADKLDRTFLHAQSQLQLLRQAKGISRGNPSKMSEYLQEASQKSNLYSWVGIVNRHPFVSGKSFA